jgi:hypothetical protein
MKKYKSMRVPMEAYEGLGLKKSAIEQILKEEKINKRFTIADTLRYLSKKKMFIYNDEVINFVKNKRNKKENTRLI